MNKATGLGLSVVALACVLAATGVSAPAQAAPGNVVKTLQIFTTSTTTPSWSGNLMSVIVGGSGPNNFFVLAVGPTRTGICSIATTTLEGALALRAQILSPDTQSVQCWDTTGNLPPASVSLNAPLTGHQSFRINGSS